MKKRSFLALLFTPFLLSSCSLLEYFIFGDNDYPIVKDQVGEIKEGPYVAPDDIEFQPFTSTYKELSKQKSFDTRFCPSTGDVNVLLIPFVSYDSKLNEPGMESQRNMIISDLNYCFNGPDEKTGWMSFKSYFDVSSFGMLNLNTTIADQFYVSNKSVSEMGQDEGAYTTALETIEAVKWYKETYKTNCDEFDSDKDGFIDTVILIYAENDYFTQETITGKESDQKNYWAYTFWCSTPREFGDVASPKPDTFIWASYDFMYSEKEYSKTGKFVGSGSKLIDIDAHTYIHEFGHCLGLDDYYNYDSDSDMCFGGGFDMQDCNVGDHNSFSKFALGWSKPYVPIDDCTISLEPSTTKKDQFILLRSGGYNEWNKSPFDEYLLIEFYTSDGCNFFDSHNKTYDYYPVGTKDFGIRLYHIDARLYCFDLDNSYGRVALDKKGYAQQITNDDGKYFYAPATTNTTKGNELYCSPVSECVKNNYSLCHLISKTKFEFNNPLRESFSFKRNCEKYGEDSYFFSRADLFKQGDFFGMISYQDMFSHPGYMNEKSSTRKYERLLGFTFEITNLTSSNCTIKIDRID